MRYNATKAMRHLDSDPSAGTAAVYGEVPAKCPAERVEVDESKDVDPARCPDPGKSDLDRADRSHLAFGFGLRSCLGQYLARLDLLVALEELLARTSSFSLSGDVVRRSYPVLSVNEMPLRMDAAAPSEVA
ncbi:cytochrome P450 [Streptomyces graminofaciens]|uniref:cytochrome P450 n=1 Tax=Streptomyces graminofaciens TaxID=68212 RepID=UPI00257366C8|nr:cytochrome P450 [Streptomyces graminofaciens]